MMSGLVQAVSLARRSAPAHLLGHLGLTAVSVAAPIVTVWLTKLTVDELATPSSWHNVWLLAVGLAVAGLLSAAGPQASRYLVAESNRRMALTAKDELFAALERQIGLARFEDPPFLDRLRLAQQSAAAPGGILESVLGVGRNVLTGLGLLGTLTVISPLVTVVVLASGLPMLLVELRLSRRRARTMQDISPAQRREIFYQELLGGGSAAKEVRLLGLGGFLRGRIRAELRLANAGQRAMDWREFVMQSVLVVMSAVVSGFGLIWVIVMVAGGQGTVGDVALLIGALAGVHGALAGAVSATAGTHFQLLTFGHYMAVLRAEPDLAQPAAPRRLPELRRGIELRDVWFRYSDEHPWILRGVDLFIPHGCSVALVGLNGSGKSTLVKLLCRLYDPVRGSILWDGVDLRDVPVTELRTRIGAVFQDFMNYDFSAADNIAVGDLSAAPPRIEDAARRAGVHETLRDLPQGYDTLLTRMFFGLADRDDESTGVVLSGGQWQRIAIARAFLRADRDLMILDEPSAGLDAEAEHDVHSRLREIRSGRTSLLISHRLGAVRDADLIVVLADGLITESGRHADLMAVGGTYSRLFDLQASGYLAETVPDQASVAGLSRPVS
ncbi:ATP-binding cassette, subfamily B [Nonomuraea solani]|uniref:ATP-binding cassette, subfamily B n=1 Tax=Nonomuraea solani TaxID=1144553 RepID=A0A1H6CR39_9ACTN|nr:ABC transporter ATP-binding protein [Nonomuraea solani]SEG75519.1 ATP-binding cassette, subfamily B [Nonomuraea solani]